MLDDFGNWLRATLEKLSRKSDTAAAIQYALNLWPALLRYCANGIIEIDNSAAERALRGVAIGRRNYLFAGADSGGERAVAVYSLIGTAKLNGVDSEAWLCHVLTTSPITLSTKSMTSCLGTAPRSSLRLKQHTASRGVMPSSSNSLPGSRRRWLYAYTSVQFAMEQVSGLRGICSELEQSDKLQFKKAW